MAWTSDQSWADEWSIEIYGRTSDVGNYGNFTRDDHEPIGPHGVVLARDFHKGRIVIVGDQNMWGDAFINYADNYRLWINATAWLLRDPSLADWKAYENQHKPRVVLYEPDDAARFGSAADEDYYSFLCLVERYYWTFANDRLEEPADLRIVADGRHSYTEAEVTSLMEYVRGGGKLLILSAAAGDANDEEKKVVPRASLSKLLDTTGAKETSTGPHHRIPLSRRWVHRPAVQGSQSLLCANRTGNANPQRRGRASRGRRSWRC